MRVRRRLWAVIGLAAALAGAVRATPPGMIELAGSPADIGRLWGETNRAAIRHDFEQYFMAPARQEGLTEAELLVRSARFVGIARRIAPHWLTEAWAVADAAGLDRQLYVAYIASVYRGLFLHDECTSYAMPPKFAQDGLVLFHKNRDNAPKDQSAAIITSSVPGVHKFITITDASVLACMMMVNDQGLAGSADTGGALEVTRPSNRGVMNTFILRHIAERAGSCQEALAIVEQFVRNRWYAGGGSTGTHWCFADRTGAVLEISTSSDRVEHRWHSGDKVYFSVREDTLAARALAKARPPVSLALFHGVARDPSICFDTSIAGFTVAIDRRQPDLLTTAWVSLPARGWSFPLLMGGRATPRPLVDGAAYTLMDSRHPDRATLERADAAGLAAWRELAARLAGGGDQAANIDDWVAGQAAAGLAAMQGMPPAAADTRTLP